MKEITQALQQAQKEFPTIQKESNNPFFKSKYAGLATILPVVMPILNKHKIVIVQNPITEGDRIGIKTQIIHASGEMLESSFTVQLTKNDSQGAGSAITYCRRYALVSMLSLNCDIDDDANATIKEPRGLKKDEINNDDIF